MWPRRTRFSRIQTHTRNILYLLFHNIIIPSDFVNGLKATLKEPRNYAATSRCDLFSPIFTSKEGHEQSNVLLLQCSVKHITRRPKCVVLLSAT
jgi:hypothetical protein